MAKVKSLFYAVSCILLKMVLFQNEKAGFFSIANSMTDELKTVELLFYHLNQSSLIDFGRHFHTIQDSQLLMAISRHI